MMGVEMEGVTPNVNPNVVGIGLGKKRVRGMVSQDVAIKFYVKGKPHALPV